MPAMAVGGSAYIVLVAVLLFFLDSVSGQNIITQYPSVANLSSSWSNTPSANIITFWESTGVEPILVTGSFVCGFHCESVGSSCLFAISIFQRASNDTLSPRMVWSANRNNPVEFGARLQLTGEGDLVLRDPYGTRAWSTNTAGKSVAGMKLTEDGNLVLFARNNSVDVWQSFDHPTDSLLLGQRLVSGQKLVASVSTSDWGEGLYSLAFDDNALLGYFEPETNRPRLYFGRSARNKSSTDGIYSCQYVRGSFCGLEFPQTSSAQFLKVDSDGHLKIYSWGGYDDWDVLSDLLTEYMSSTSDECGYTGGCGEYGICLNNTCSCPASNQSDYFKQKDGSKPSLGCYATTPISCDSHSLHSLLAADYMSIPSGAHSLMRNTTEESCKQACLNNCSCAAVSIYTDLILSSMSCHLFSSPLFNSTGDYVYSQYRSRGTVFVRVQNPPPTDAPLGKKQRNVQVSVFLTIGACLFFLRYKKASEQIEENDLDQALGMPARFSYKNLKVMTRNFSTKLGEGGFGSVFLGTLPDGTTEIAVKQLDGFGQVKKSFLAEVQTIGSIHHVNLVKLVGFCAEKAHRLLVYEYMCSGSLDKWVFNRTQALDLSWQCRRRIIRDIAKGLAYLHEDCNQKILHLDIKPQNILLDENLNAKVSDFGLAKLISKEETEVVTAMRGTPGYMAPEWLSSVITEKVDVYSFGVVVLEILCGRKNLDRSQPEEDMHLLSVFERKAKEDSVLDMVESKLREGMDETRRSEVMELMKVAAWCLQSDFTKRPSMHLVIKVLEGSVAVEENLEYEFSIGPLSRTTAAIDCIIDPSTILPSKLSGPR